MDNKDLEKYSRVYARVSLSAIEANLLAMKGNIPEGTRIMAVIKTDAYGHGAVEIGKFLEGKDYIWGYATATAEEAFELRDAGLKKPILILGYTFPYAYERMLTEDIRPSVFRMDMAKELDECAKGLIARGILTEPAPIHLAVDTGMSRIGITPDEAGVSFARDVRLMANLHIEGVFTHFARADEKDLTNAREREEVFKSFLKAFEEECGYRIPIKHCANSASIIAIPESSMDMVRAGVTMYGMWPSDEVPRDIIDLKPAMELISHIVMVKDSCQLRRNICDREGFNQDCDYSCGLWRWLSEKPFQQRLCSDRWPSCSNTRQSLHGSVHGGCHGYSRCA